MMNRLGTARALELVDDARGEMAHAGARVTREAGGQPEQPFPFELVQVAAQMTASPRSPSTGRTR